MKSFFLMLSFALPSLAYSQVTGYYQQGDVDDTYDVWIEFNKDKYVVIIFDFRIISLPAPVHISYGAYIQKGNLMYLTDSLYGYTILLRQDHDTLFGEQGLPLFKGKKFIDKTLYEKNDVYFFCDKVYPKEERLSFLDKNQSLHPLQCGTYNGTYDSGTSSFFSLELNNNETYVYKCGGIIISSGTWKRAGALLVLADDNLNFGFFMLIAANNILIDNTMPNYVKPLQMILLK